MPLTRDDLLQIKLQQLDALKQHMGDFNGSRLAALKNKPALPDAGEVDDLAGAGDEESPEEDAAEGGEEIVCPHCEHEIDLAMLECPECHGAIASEGEGEESDGARLEALAEG